MSEYHYYEFQAVDRPLTMGEKQELRALSTRAQITATSSGRRADRLLSRLYAAAALLADLRDVAAAQGRRRLSKD